MATEKNTKKLAGFSFVESVVAIFILTAGIVAIMPFLGRSMGISNGSRDQIIASLLAQEGVELVQNIRDNAWVDGDFSTTSFSKIPDGSGRVDKASTTFLLSSSYQLYLDGNGFYVHGSGNSTKFYRKLTVEDVSGNKRVTSMVVWDGAGSFPAVADCNMKKQCAYAQVTLTKWGE